MGIKPIIKNCGKDYNEIIDQTVPGTLDNRRSKIKRMPVMSNKLSSLLLE